MNSSFLKFNCQVHGVKTITTTTDKRPWEKLPTGFKCSVVYVIFLKPFDTDRLVLWRSCAVNGGWIDVILNTIVLSSRLVAYRVALCYVKLLDLFNILVFCLRFLCSQKVILVHEQKNILFMLTQCEFNYSTNFSVISLLKIT